MRKVAAVALAGGLLFLAGCSAQSDQAVAHAGCIESAKEQLPSNAKDVNTSKLETSNVSEAMREVIENPLEPDPDDPALYATTGDIWYRTANGDDQSRSVLCTVEMLDGKPTEPIEAAVTNG